ncbi:hypothetical protein [Burkholderia cenocepacia]|uniref:hypothetical protein n=1 Tax=Burkholderia cenocepacia TaxID=95486 RepID=UPI000F5A3C65|nr:hypothetical protein [Burkholderia cenocepacia]
MNYWLVGDLIRLHPLSITGLLPEFDNGCRIGNNHSNELATDLQICPLPTMNLNWHALAQLGFVATILITAIARWRRWREARAQGMNEAQFALASGQSAEKVRARAKSARMLGWGLICFPFVLAAISMIHRRESVSMIIAGTLLFEIIFGGLGWIFLWMAKSNEELARRM